MKMLILWKEIAARIVARWKSGFHDKADVNTAAIVLTKYQVKTSWQDKFMKALTAYTVGSLGATGNIMAEAYYENGDARTMWLLERWHTQAFYTANKKTAAAKAIDDLKRKGLESPADTIFIKDLDLFSKETTVNVPETNEQPVTIMVTIEVNRGTENYFKSINHDLMLALQDEPGVFFFQFGQVVNSPSRFIVYKKLRNWQTFQQHLKEPALEPIMQFLRTSVKDPPFEKNYHHLIPFASP